MNSLSFLVFANTIGQQFWWLQFKVNQRKNPNGKERGSKSEL